MEIMIDQNDFNLIKLVDLEIYINEIRLSFLK